MEQNARRLKELAGAETTLMAMVKANGYGHGAVEAARAAVRGGAAWLGVYAPGEGIELREAGLTAPILVLGPTPPEWTRAALERDLTLTIPGLDYVEPVIAAARALGRAARVHIKVDTGMTRLGLDCEGAAEDIVRLAHNPDLEVEGVLTHYAAADDPNLHEIPHHGEEFTRAQQARLLGVLDQLEAAGVRVPYRHAANSPGTMHYPHPRLNLVRSGILLYGLHPSADTPRPEGFEPALAFKTRLALVRQVPPGRFVSYGATFETRRPSRIGVLMVGYADGFRRGPRNYGEGLIRGQRVPLVGRVCMDQCMVDVTDVPDANAGDEAVLIGRQGDEEITAEEVAARLGTNNYETVTTISARVPRVYQNSG